MSFMTRHRYAAAARSLCSVGTHVDDVDTSEAEAPDRSAWAKGLRDPLLRRSPSPDRPRTIPSSAWPLALASCPGCVAVPAIRPDESGCRRPWGPCYHRLRLLQSSLPPPRDCPAHLRRTMSVAAARGPRRRPTG